MTDDLEIQLKKALEECAQLRAENMSLRQKLGMPEILEVAANTKSSSAQNSFSIEQKVGLFRSYFRGREDIYALRWEGKDGKVPMLRKMFERRLTGYKTIGYSSQKEVSPNQDLNLGRKAPELAYQMEQMT